MHNIIFNILSMCYIFKMKNILFDLDGTLTDPQEGIFNCIEYALEKMGAEKPPRISLKKYIGPSLWESFKEMLATENDDLATKAVLTYRERFSTVGKFENLPYEGIHQSLENLQNAGFNLYICTSKPDVFAKDIADHFEFSKYFKQIYGSMLDGTMVDKTELIAHIIKTENLSAVETAMIGDRKYDILGGINNKLHPYGVSYGFGMTNELRGALKVFDTPIEISEHFTSLHI